MNPFQIVCQRPVFTLIANAARWGAGAPRAEASVAPPPYYAYYSTILADGPEAYWRLDETAGASAVDEIGARNGLISNLDIAASALVAGSAYSFYSSAGVGGYVGLASSLAAGEAVFVAEAWVQLDAAPAAGKYAPIYYESNLNSLVKFALLLNDSTRTLRLYTRDTLAGAIEILTGDNMPLDKLLHLVGVSDTTAGMQYLYANSVLSNSSATTIGAHYNDQGSSGIGATYYDANVSPIDGRIDEVAVYTSALTAAQIRNHYALGLGYASATYPFEIITDGPVGYWKLDAEAVGSTANSEVNVNRDMTTRNITVVSALASGAGDGAMRFNGTNSYLQSTVAFPVYTSASYEFLMQASSTSAGQRFLTFNAQAPYLKWEITGASTITFRVGLSPVTEITASVNVTGINHIVGTYKQSGQQRVYVNGSVVSSSTAPASMTKVAGSDNNHIGASRTPDSWYDGIMDEVALYPRALTSTEVLEHYLLTQGYQSGTYPFVILRDSPVGYWRSDSYASAGSSTIVNEATEGHDMVASNTTIVSALAAGLGDGAIWYNGSTTYLQDATAFPTYSSASFELTVQASATGQFERFLAWNAQLPYVRFDTTAAGNIEYRVGVSPNTIITASSVTVTDVNHIVGTYKQSGQMRLYINGVVQASSTAPASLTKVGTEPYNHIGASRTPDTWFNGVIDDVAFYPRALSSAEVSSHYLASNS